MYYDKNKLINNNYMFNKKQQNFNRNISARNIYRNNSKNIFSKSTIDQGIINSGILRNIKIQEVKEYKNKKDKYLNQSTKVTKSKKISGSFYNYNYNYNDSRINDNKMSSFYRPGVPITNRPIRYSWGGRYPGKHESNIHTYSSMNKGRLGGRKRVYK